MKKLITVIIIFAMFTLKVNALDISSKNAILYNLDTNEIIYQKDKDKKISIASLTKLMTALITIENIDDINRQIILKNSDFKGLAEANAVTAGFTKGQIVTYKDLLYGLLLPSGADAAKALARNVAGTEEDFIKKMNKKVKELKLKNTHFSTVIGLDDENNYSTVKEVSIIFKEVLKNKHLNKIIKSNTYTTTDGTLTFKSTIQSNAKKYNISIPYILGGKTGTTTGAGLCLATVAKANNVNYMLVTAGATYDKKAPHHIIDAKIVYDYFIDNYSNQKIVDKNKPFKTLKTKYTKETLKLYPNKNITKYLNNNYNKKDVKLIYNGIEEVTPFDKKGKNLGTLKIYYKNELLDTQKIILNQTLKFNLLSFIKQEKIIIIIIIISILLLLIIALKKRAK